MDVKVEALDTARRKYAYDGEEPDWNTKIPVPMARLDYAFSFSEVFPNKFDALPEKIGQTAFDKIVESQGYVIPTGEFARFKGENNLPMFYYIRPDDKPNAVKLMLVSLGEFQPGRYLANFEGIYRLTGAQF